MKLDLYYTSWEIYNICICSNYSIASILRGASPLRMLNLILSNKEELESTIKSFFIKLSHEKLINDVAILNDQSNYLVHIVLDNNIDDNFMKVKYPNELERLKRLVINAT